MKFSKNKEIQELLRLSNRLSDLAGAMGVLSWDTETYMPRGGSEARAKQLATLAGIYHTELTGYSAGELISKAAESTKNDFDRGLVREMQREFDQASKLPVELVQKISEATSRAFVNWRKAKEEDDFGLFEQDLKAVLGLKIEAANLLKSSGQSAYDVMIDEHEQGLTEAGVERVFRVARPRLKTLANRLEKLTAGTEKTLLSQEWTSEKQWQLTMKAIELLGYDLDRGRVDKSAHPFTINFGSSDVRITTWEAKDDPRPMLYATIHEGGHALYEQGVDPDLERTVLGSGQGLVMHESQSRLWENVVGRNKVFLNQLGLKNWEKGVNIVKPGPVRVEADEVTYGLHIIIRFEIERELIRGSLEVKNLPEAWRAKYKDFLGVEPSSDREGVLQDVHWAHGSFGYFPTYLLGSMTAAQIWKTVPEEIKKLDSLDIKKLRDWLAEKIHRWGKTYTPRDLLIRATGEDLNPEYFFEYLENKFAELYN